jgi:hypothetical protein
MTRETGERTGGEVTYHAEVVMTFEDFVRRRSFYDERLLTIEPIIDRFCAANGYIRDNNTGQYPRRSFRRVGEVERYAEVALGSGPKGEQNWDLADDAMFELHAGVNVVRGSVISFIYCGYPNLRVPLTGLPGMFEAWLTGADALMSVLDAETVMRSGHKVDRDAPFRLEDVAIPWPPVPGGARQP